MSRAVIVGPPGSGKTTVGRVLAGLLGVPLHDTDQAIEQAQGRSIADIFVEDGEAAFRDLERAGHVVVFLDVGIADAAKRVGFDTSRPLLAVNPRSSWVRLMADRRPIYERVSAHRVDTAGRAPEDVAAEVAALLGEQ